MPFLASLQTRQPAGSGVACRALARIKARLFPGTPLDHLARNRRQII